MSALLVLLGLTLLLFTKRSMTGQLTHLIHRLGGGQRGVIITWSLIFLPGTLIHEVSHFLLAAFTGARTGRIEIFPEYLEEEAEEELDRQVTLGYVQTQRLNPIQGFLVGTAPFLLGLPFIILLSFLIRDAYAAGDYRLLIPYGYLFFTIGNSFFPSTTDIKQAIPLVVVSVIFAVLAWIFLGFRFMFTPTPFVQNLLSVLSGALFLSVVLNLVIIAILSVSNQVLRRHR